MARWSSDIGDLGLDRGISYHPLDEVVCDAFKVDLIQDSSNQDAELFGSDLLVAPDLKKVYVNNAVLEIHAKMLETGPLD